MQCTSSLHATSVRPASARQGIVAHAERGQMHWAAMATATLLMASPCSAAVGLASSEVDASSLGWVQGERWASHHDSTAEASADCDVKMKSIELPNTENTSGHQSSNA